MKGKYSLIPATILVLQRGLFVVRNLTWRAPVPILLARFCREPTTMQSPETADAALKSVLQTPDAFALGILCILFSRRYHIV